MSDPQVEASMPHIQSVQNSTIKEVVKLRTRRGRKVQGRIIIDGVRETQRAFAAGLEIIDLYLPESLLEEPGSDPELLTLLQAGLPLTTVSDTVLQKIAYGDRTGSVVAVARTPHLAMEAYEPPEHPLVMVLEAVEKPGNIGAVARTADAAGFDALILADPITDAYNPNAIRSSLGALFNLAVVTGDNGQVLAWLRSHQFQILAARVDATAAYHQQDYTRSTAMVVGNEADGLSAAWHAEDIFPIRLPMHGISDSLNVSTSAAILMYEARRQRDC